MNEKKINIKMVIENDEAKKFSAVKKILGVSANTEAIRVLISQKYLEIKNKNPEPEKPR